METELSLPYVAGIVDGEGCISIHVNRSRAARFANQKPRVVMQLAVSNCCERLIDQLWFQFGGTKQKHLDRYNPRARDNWRWCLSEQAACRLVEKLRPYLFVKQKQADLLLKLGQLKAANKSRTLTDQDVQQRLEIAQECGELNKRGRM